MNKEEVEAKVIKILSNASGFEPEEIKDDNNLKNNLGLTHSQKSGLAPSLTKIVRTINPDETISRNECEKLKTVQDCIDLVNKKIKKSD